MTRYVFSLALAASLALSTLPLEAQNRQELQVQADLRMLQEQVSRLQLATNQLADQLKTVNSRIDQNAQANLKTFADQQVLINQIASGVSTVREKLDDNTVRVSQLTEEFSAVRNGLRMLTDQLNALVSLLQPPTAAADPSAAGAPGSAAPSSSAATNAAPPIGPVNIPSSPVTLYMRANGDYLAGRYDFAIEGFQELIKTYPDSPTAANAQMLIAESYYGKDMCRETITEAQKVVNTYKTSDVVPGALLLIGMCNQSLTRRAEAQRVYEQLIKQYPQSTEATMAKQRLEALAAGRR